MIKVCLTGAAGQIAYSLIPLILSGQMFGKNTEISLVLLDIEPAIQSLLGVVMEIQDSCYLLLKEIIWTTDLATAFKGIDYAILIGAIPRSAGMERSDLLLINVPIFKDQGIALNKYAKESCKIIVVGNPVNTNAFIVAKYATNIPKKNISCLMKLDENRAIAQLATQLSVKLDSITDLFVWGNHSVKQFPDFHNAKVNGESVALTDNQVREMTAIVQNRGASVIQQRKLSSAMSAAKAIVDHVHALHFGGAISMGVWSNGEYGAPKDCIFSFPCICANKDFEICKLKKIDSFDLRASSMEIVQEKETAQKALGLE